MEKRRRLKKETDFRRVRREGRCWKHRLLIVCVLPGEAAETRLGVVVGKRVGNAVERNRVKRRIREAFRQRLAGLDPRWDVVIVARVPARDASFWDIDAAMARFLLQGQVGTSAQAPVETSDEKDSAAAD